jgi:cyclophilin family peptidyl-prolyl cis-trans isomerase/HEAT repeat protein
VTRRIITLVVVPAIAAWIAACASAPPIPPKPPEPSQEQKLAWILRLEDQRMLRDPTEASLPVVVPSPSKPQKPNVPSPPPPPPPPDLVRMLRDGEARIRRRAALAVGRVGLAEGVKPLVDLLADPEPEVRQMAAFALGLVAHPSARDPLIASLADPSLLVKGSAAEALGLLGDAGAADVVAKLALELVQSGSLAELPTDEADVARDSAAGAFRLAVYALARLNAFSALASAVLDDAGLPRIRWWPVAYALQRLEDPRAQPALRALAADSHPYTRAFAAKGLGITRDRSAVSLLSTLSSSPDRLVAIEAVRGLGRIGDAAATPALVALLQAPKTIPYLRLEAVTAIASLGGEGASDILIDLLGDRVPAIRAAAMQGLARLDPEGFVFILSGLDPDAHWSVRAALADALGSLPAAIALPRLRTMLNDPDQRVISTVVTALARLRPPDAAQVIAPYLKADDPVVRAAAARALGQIAPAESVSALTDAYRAGLSEPLYVARAAALSALAVAGGVEAIRILNEALADPDWAVRVHAATLLLKLDPGSDALTRIRPAPGLSSADRYTAQHVVNPSVSTQLHVETDRGTIQIELAVLDAPLGVDNLVTLARKGFYDGLTFHRVVPGFVVQTGDPRGDSEGGPGYTIRDELNQRPYVRGTVGMALDWEDTGGSQWFITQSPQPHLDGRYTVVGRVVAGMDAVDQVEQWDVIHRVHVWDGETFTVLR